MGRSREPPVFARFGTTSNETKFTRVARYTPKRLPSRRWAITRRINPKSAFEDEDDDEYENERPNTKRQAPNG